MKAVTASFAFTRGGNSSSRGYVNPELAFSGHRADANPSTLYVALIMIGIALAIYLLFWLYVRFFRKEKTADSPMQNDLRSMSRSRKIPHKSNRK
jgi:hypothetical protein